MYVCGYECVIRVQECVNVVIVEPEGPRVRSPAFVCDVPAAGPDARQPRERSSPALFVNKGPEVRPAEPGWV